MTTKQLLDKVGGLSTPSKMPCHGWSISAKKCNVGSKLRKVKGSICSVCYALKGRYVFDNVQKALDRRFKIMQSERGNWIINMVAAIKKVEKSGYFRWFDSGDVIDLEHLEDIVRIAVALPHIKFWLPTKEHGVVAQYVLKHGTKGKSFPRNLTVRLSGYMLDGPAPTSLAKRLGVQASGVSKDSFNCPSSRQGNKCGDCRACWDKTKMNINYKKH